MRNKVAIKKGIFAGAFLFGLIVAGVTVIGLGNNAIADLSVNGPRDCDSNAVLNCGALSTSELKQKYTANATGDVATIYNHFGISSSNIDSLSTKAEVGTVKADGTVWIGNKLIGVNAKTAGRHKTTNSVAIPGTTAYTRPPSDSFASSSTTISVFVGFKDGIANWGIITSCGNPITWDSPDVLIEKVVRTLPSGSWQNEVTVNNSDEVEFKVHIKELSGKLDAQDVVVTDLLPKGLEYTPGSLTVAGVAKDFSNGTISVGVAPKQISVDVIFRAKTKLADTVCGNTPIDNLAKVSGLNFASKQDSAIVHVNKPCDQPKLVCSSLVFSPQSGLKQQDTVRMTATASSENVNNITYTFVVNNVEIQKGAQSSADYKITTSGSHAVKVTVSGTGTNGAAITGSCSGSFSVDTPVTPQTPTVVCTKIAAPSFTLKSGDTLTVTATANALNGGMINGYKLFVNNVLVKETNSQSENSLSYIVTQSAGTYPVRVVVKSSVGEATSTSCDSTITVSNPAQGGDEPTITVTCERLDVPRLTINAGDIVQLTAQASATGTSIKNYAFLVNGQTLQTSTSKTFQFSRTQPGRYSVQVNIEPANGGSVTSDACKKTIDVIGAPVVQCVSLKAQQMNITVGQSTMLDAESFVSNATINTYKFTIDGAEVQNTAASQYAFKPTAAGTYTAKVVILSSLGEITSANCQKTITVTAVTTQPQTPTYKCEAFTLSKSSVKVGESVQMNARISTQNGATFKSATFVFGDEVNGQGQAETKTLSGDTATVSHTYQKAGGFSPRVLLDFDVNGQTKRLEDSNCVGQIVVTQTEVNGAKTTLPNTGAGAFLGLSGISSLAIGVTTYRKKVAKYRKANR